MRRSINPSRDFDLGSIRIRGPGDVFLGLLMISSHWFLTGKHPHISHLHFFSKTLADLVNLVIHWMIMIAIWSSI